MEHQAIQSLQRLAQDNQQALAQQIDRYAGQQLARRQADAQRREPAASDLMRRDFDSLSEREQKQLRDEVRRLAARLRTRISLRLKRARTAGSTPSYAPRQPALRRRAHEPAPQAPAPQAALALICDVSTSMRPAVEFLLRLVYELQDQIHQTHSFVFIDRLEDISEVFKEQRPQQAVESVLANMPPGHYNTDLGAALAELAQHSLSALDRRTTVILLGDARNNYNDPRLDAFQAIKAHARRLIWLTPEPPGQWGTGDSDMLRYVALCDAVHEVNNLEQLARAIDRILAE